MPGDVEYSQKYIDAITAAGGTPTRTPPDIKDTIKQLGQLIGGQSGTYEPLIDVVVSASGDTSGATDNAALQTALTAARTAGSGRVRGVAGKIYYITSLVIGTNVTLDMSDCIIVQVTGTNVSAITNYAQTAAATGTATTTAYSTTVTTGLATSQAAVGQSIVIVGAAGTGATPLVGKIKSVNSVAGTLVIENLDNSVLQASQSVTSHTATLYNRDSNVRIIGGNWQFGSNSSGGNVPADNHILL